MSRSLHNLSRTTVDERVWNAKQIRIREHVGRMEMRDEADMIAQHDAEDAQSNAAERVIWDEFDRITIRSLKCRSCGRICGDDECEDCLYPSWTMLDGGLDTRAYAKVGT